MKRVAVTAGFAALWVVAWGYAASRAVNGYLRDMQAGAK